MSPDLPVESSSPVVSAVPTAGDVLRLVREGRAHTRSEIGALTGLSRTAVTARLGALLESGLLLEGQEGPSRGGRPPAQLVLNSRAGVVLAAAVGRSRTQLAVADLDGSPVSQEVIDQEVGAAPQDLLPVVAEHLGRLLTGSGRGAVPVRAVGLSIPGTVDTARGVSVDSPIMAGWNGLALAPYFTDLLSGSPDGVDGAPVVVDNDVNALATAESDGHLRRYSDLLLVKASTGLGAGVVVGGRLVRGASGAAGEIGHTKVAAAAGRSCRCGDTGCVEAVASGWAIVAELQEQGLDVVHVRDVARLAAAGDSAARHLVRESGRRVGEVLAGAVNLLNPEALVVGGDMVLAYDTFAAGVRESVYGGATALATRALDVVPATHGDQSGVVGCTAMALERVLAPEAVDAALRA